MNQERKKLGFELMLDNLKANFGWMMLTNLMFAIPLLVSVAVAYVLCLYVLPIVPVTLPLAIVFASPFYSGVVFLSRVFSQGKKPEKMFRTFWRAVRENGLKFLFGGFLCYISFLVCYFSVSIYIGLAAENWFFYLLMFISVLICLFCLFLFYAAPLMTVSFDLKLKDIFKNSALMTFGELKYNFFATLSILAYLAVVLMPIIVIFYSSSVFPAIIVKALLVVYGALSLALLIPTPCAMMISNYLYPRMLSVIADDDSSVEAKKSSAHKVKSVIESVVSDDSEIDIDELRKGDGEEYIFYQGKMIKRKTLIEEMEAHNNEEC